MDFEVFGHLIDAPGQDRDLYFWRPCISFVYTRIRNNLCLFFECQCHACFLPPAIQQWEQKITLFDYNIIPVGAQFIVPIGHG